MNPPKALDDYFPELWKTYEFKDDKFKIRLPGKPDESASNPNRGGILRDNTVTYAGVISYRIISAEYSTDFEKTGKAEVALNMAKQHALDEIKDLEPRITKEANLTLGGHPGKFIRVETNQGEVIRTKILIVNSHAYILIAASGKEAPNVMGSENDYEKIATTFLDSFELIAGR